MSRSRPPFSQVWLGSRCARFGSGEESRAKDRLGPKAERSKLGNNARGVVRLLNSIEYYGIRRGAPGAASKFYGQAERAISTGKLSKSPCLHFLPIKQVIFLCPSLPLRVGRSHLGECFPLICIQRLSQPNFATQPCHGRDSWNTRGSSIPVLSY